MIADDDPSSAEIHHLYIRPQAWLCQIIFKGFNLYNTEKSV